MKSPRTRLAALLALLVAGVLLAGCHGATPLPFRLTDLTGHMPQLEFNLTSDENKPVSAVDYRGKVVLLFFGYTHCPDVCPLTMTQLHVVMKKLGVALELKDVDMHQILESAGFPVSKPELSALFRQADHKNFKLCGDQLLRNFLKGLTLRLREGR